MTQPYGVRGMMGVVDEMKGKIEKSLLYGGTFANSVNITPKPLSVDSIIETVNMLRKTVILVRLWLVDRPDYFNLIHSVFPESSKFALPSLTMDVPIIQFDRIAFHSDREIIAKPDEDIIKLRNENRGKTVWPFWCATPGIYWEMSDGSVRVLRATHEKIAD